MAEFLLELLSEEIPARMQLKAAAHLHERVWKVLGDLGLNDDELTFARYFTPRRIVLTIDQLKVQQPDKPIRRKGPRVGAPEVALEGFKRSLGDQNYELVEQQDKKGAIYIAEYTLAGRPTIEVLAETLPEILQNFPWPKSMRWGNYDVRWVRPLENILCVLDNEIVPFSFGPISSGKISYGHRFHAPEPFEVGCFDDYKKKLGKRFVVLDHFERRNGIETQAKSIAKQHGLLLREDQDLLDEVTGLVEWPVAVCGGIDKEFMALPPEVLVTSMRAHQKYLALEDESGNLAARFIAVANLEAKDGGEAIIAGNERVLRARLWDAKFFWDHDGRRPLDELVPKLDDIVFHAKLGSVGDKVRRTAALVDQIARDIPGASIDAATRAAELAKADLVTGMVGEFPELQGVMGRYYAQLHGEAPSVAAAIGDHYAPQGPSDNCPSAPVSIALALADKLDTLAGFFAIDEKPTGSKDPFGLRRAALGIIRLILENQIRLPLNGAILQALDKYGDRFVTYEEYTIPNNLLDFITERLKVHLRQHGVRHDLINAVFAVRSHPFSTPPFDFDMVGRIKRINSLEAFLTTDDGINLLAAYRRATNIVRIEAKKDGIDLDGDVEDALLEAGEERILYDGLVAAERRIDRALESENFADAMSALADLRQPIDAFFDKVIVNADDPKVRKNRLNLLNNIHWSIATIADFSLIEDVTSENHNRRVA